VAGRPPPRPCAASSRLGTDLNAAERASALVLTWARTYTRRLPRELAEARRDELACDLWEQRTDASLAGRTSTSVALAILRRMLAGVPADLSWRHGQLAAAARKPHTQRIDGRLLMVHHWTPLTRARLRFSTRRCKACGERYQRKYPYCPVCKTKPGHQGIPRNPNWGSPVGL